MTTQQPDGYKHPADGRLPKKGCSGGSSFGAAASLPERSGFAARRPRD